MEGTVRVVVVPEVGGVVFASPRRVGGGEVNGEAEWVLRVGPGVEELERVVDEQVRGVAALVFPDLAVFHHGYHVVARPAVGHGVPRPEAGAWREAVAQVPLAGKAGVVAEAGEQFGVGLHALKKRDAVGGNRLVQSRVAGVGLPVQEVVNPVLRRDATGEDRRPGRRTDRRGAEEIVEPDAFARQPVQVRRADLGIAGAAHGPGTLVVGQDEQDVGAVGVAAGHRRLRCDRATESGQEAPFVPWRDENPRICVADQDAGAAERKVLADPDRILPVGPPLHGSDVSQRNAPAAAHGGHHEVPVADAIRGADKEPNRRCDGGDEQRRRECAVWPRACQQQNRQGGGPRAKQYLATGGPANRGAEDLFRGGRRRECPFIRHGAWILGSA